MIRTRLPQGRDRGSLSLEAAILAPVILALFLLVVVAGRVRGADNVVADAARNAARAASMERDGTSARNQAIATAESTFQDQGLKCGQAQVDVDTAGFGASLGTPASVTVSVSCQVMLSDLAVPGVPIPGTHQISSHFSSPIDPYRGRPAS